MNILVYVALVNWIGAVVLSGLFAFILNDDYKKNGSAWSDTRIGVTVGYGAVMLILGFTGYVGLSQGLGPAERAMLFRWFGA